MNPLYCPVKKILFGILLFYCGSAFAFTLPEFPELGEGLAPIAGTVVTDAGTLETQVQPLTSVLGSHIRGIQRGFARPAGGGAGTADSGFQGMWVNSSYTAFENTFSRTEFDGNSHLLLLGFDFSVSENILYGVALGSERSDIDTTFNRGNQEIDGTVIAPYFGWLITDVWSIDVSLGLSDLDTDQFRTEMVTTIDSTSSPPLVFITESPEIVSSTASSERTFTSVNINGFWTVGNWNLGSWLGYLSTKSDQDAYTESNGSVVAGDTVELKQTLIGGDVAYSLGRWEPYLGVTLVKDSSAETLEFPDPPQPSDDDDSMLIAAGWRYYGEDGVSAVLEWNTRDGKDDYSEDGVSFTLRVDFN